MSTKAAIPSAGPDFEHLLAQEVVIEAFEDTTRTGAQRVAPDHSPRAPIEGAQHIDSLSRLRERAGVRASVDYTNSASGRG